MSKGKKSGQSAKDPDAYDTMRDKGMSKGKAARVSNAQRTKGRRPNKRGSR